MSDRAVVAAVCLCGRLLVEHIEEPINPGLIVQPPIAPPDCDGFDLAHYVTDDGGIVPP